MADFTSPFWHWFVVIVSLLGILVLFPLIYKNRGNKPSGTLETMGHVWDDDLEEYNNPLPGWWLNLFVVTLVFGLIYLILYPGLGHFQGILGWSSKGQYEQEIQAASEQYDPLYQHYASMDIRTLGTHPEALKSGRRLFSNYCAACHGSDARGARGFPNLRDNEWLYGGEPDQIYRSILDGRSGVMPAWGPALGEEGVENVTHYILALGNREHDGALAEAGQQQYRQFCVACHQEDGTGNQLLGAPNLKDRIWQYGGSRETIRESIANGRHGVMPAHGEFLGAERVHLLSAYVYSLSQEYEQE